MVIPLCACFSFTLHYRLSFLWIGTHAREWSKEQEICYIAANDEICKDKIVYGISKTFTYEEKEEHP